MRKNSKSLTSNEFLDRLEGAELPSAVFEGKRTFLGERGKKPSSEKEPLLSQLRQVLTPIGEGEQFPLIACRKELYLELRTLLRWCENPYVVLKAIGDVSFLRAAKDDGQVGREVESLLDALVDLPRRKIIALESLERLYDCIEALEERFEEIEPEGEEQAERYVALLELCESLQMARFDAIQSRRWLVDGLLCAWKQGHVVVEVKRVVGLMREWVEEDVSLRRILDAAGQNMLVDLIEEWKRGVGEVVGNAEVQDLVRLCKEGLDRLPMRHTPKMTIDKMLQEWTNKLLREGYIAQRWLTRELTRIDAHHPGTTEQILAVYASEFGERPDSIGVCRQEEDLGRLQSILKKLCGEKRIERGLQEKELALMLCLIGDVALLPGGSWMRTRALQFPSKGIIPTFGQLLKGEGVITLPLLSNRFIESRVMALPVSAKIKARLLEGGKGDGESDPQAQSRCREDLRRLDGLDGEGIKELWAFYLPGKEIPRQGLERTLALQLAILEKLAALEQEREETGPQMRMRLAGEVVKRTPSATYGDLVRALDPALFCLYQTFLELGIPLPGLTLEKVELWSCERVVSVSKSLKERVFSVEEVERLERYCTDLQAHAACFGEWISRI